MSEPTGAPRPAAAGGARAVPFHCPYCGDEDLRPYEDVHGDSPHGSWTCRSCLRAFSLKLIGLVRPAGADGVASR